MLACRLLLLLAVTVLVSGFHAPLLPNLGQQPMRRAAVRGQPIAARNARLLEMSGDSGRKLSIAVVGGGPAGLAAANNLLDVESVGSVTVIERASLDTFTDGPGTWGIGVGPRCQWLLGNMTGAPWQSSIKEQCLHNPKIDFYRGNRPIIREGIYQALVAHPKASDRLKLEFGTTVSTYDLEKKQLELENNQQVDFDCLVLADGSHSTSLTAVGRPQFETRRKAFWSCVKIMPAPEIEGDTRSYIFKKGEGVSVWLMSWKDGRRYLLVFFKLNRENGANPVGMSSPAAVRDFFRSMEPSAALGPAPALDAAYWDRLEEQTLQDFLDREPRPMWTSSIESAVDEANGIVLLGDTAGTCLPTLGQGTCMAIQDAWNLKASFAAAEAAGGGGEELQRAALRHYAATGAEERKAMVRLNLLCMAIRQKWGHRLPLLKKLDAWVTKRVDDPAVSLASLYRKPWVWPVARLAQLMWDARWGLDEQYVREWRASFKPRTGAGAQDSAAAADTRQAAM